MNPLLIEFSKVSGVKAFHLSTKLSATCSWFEDDPNNARAVAAMIKVGLRYIEYHNEKGAMKKKKRKGRKGY